MAEPMAVAYNSMDAQHEYVDLGEAQVSWGGWEALDSASHCRISRRMRDGALFAEIWVPRPQTCPDSPKTWVYYGPVRLPHG